MPDVFEAMLEQERLGALRIVRWPELPEKTRDWIRRVQMEEILGAELPEQAESPRARYMQEKYPESWEMALEEIKEEKDESSK